jgi:DNA ligase (NAD+)
LSGQNFVFTGTLDALSRSEAKKRIMALGGHAKESVGREIDYVVAGRDPGSKFDQAKKLGVTILDEAAFLKLLK